MRTQRSIKLDADYGEFKNSEFLARFAVSEGSSLKSSVRTRLTAPFQRENSFPLYVYFLTDQEWDSAINSNDCFSFQNLAKFSLELSLRGDQEWSRFEEFEIEYSSRSQVWYAVVADCNGYLHKLYPAMPYIDVDIHMLNSGSEFSSEEYGVITLNIILFLVYAYFLASTTYAVVIEALRNDNVDNPTMGTILAIYMELLHIIAQTIHLFIYSYNGSGFFLLDVISTVLEMNSQFIIVGMLILIAFGWSITDVDIMKDTKYLVLGSITLVFHTMI